MCSFTTHFKKLSAWSNVFVELKICSGELEEASPLLLNGRHSLTSEAPYNTHNMKRACIEPFPTP